MSDVILTGTMRVTRVGGPELRIRIPQPDITCVRCGGTGKYANRTRTSLSTSHKDGCRCVACRPCPRCDGKGKTFE